MRDSDLLKSDASSDEKTFYAEERVRRRFRRRNHDSEVPELEKIVTRVAKLRPTSQAPTHRLPLFRTQSSSIFDAISRENFELRRQNEELALEVERLQGHIQNSKDYGRECRLNHKDIEETITVQACPVKPVSVQPEWVPEFFKALTSFIQEHSATKPTEAARETEEKPEEANVEIKTAIKELQVVLQELVTTISTSNVNSPRAQAPPNTENPPPRPPAQDQPIKPTVFVPSSIPARTMPPVQPAVLYGPSTLDYAPPSNKGTTGYTLEIIEALKDLKVAVNRPITVTLESDKVPAQSFANDHHQEPPALSSSSSTIEHEDLGPDEARKFLEQLRDSDPKQYHQVLENIHRKLSDGDSTNFQDFVNQRLGSLEQH